MQIIESHLKIAETFVCRDFALIVLDSIKTMELGDV